MSVVGLKFSVVLLLSSTVFCDPERSGVIWRKAGGSVTISCRTSTTSTGGEETLALNKGLSEDFQVLYREFRSQRNTVAPAFQGRLQVRGPLPDLDVTLTNLTSEDTGPYWCVYKKFDRKLIETKGQGSVLLVVTADATRQECEGTPQQLVVVSVVICGALLLAFIMAALVWLCVKTKTPHATVKPRRVATNDVYEDMRGTIRR